MMRKKRNGNSFISNLTPYIKSNGESTPLIPLLSPKRRPDNSQNLTTDGNETLEE